jgi:hypothetical protein
MGELHCEQNAFMVGAFQFSPWPKNAPEDVPFDVNSCRRFVHRLQLRRRESQLPTKGCFFLTDKIAISLGLRLHWAHLETPIHLEQTHRSSSWRRSTK